MEGYQESQVYSFAEDDGQTNLFYYLIDMFDELYPDFGQNVTYELVKLNDK